MNEIKIKKLKELMEKGIVSNVYHTTGKNEDRKDTLLNIEDIDSLKIDVVNAISIQQGYNYSKLVPTNFICVINNHIQNSHYSITISSQNLLDLLDMLNWDFSFSNQDTAHLFNQLMMSANKVGRSGGYSQDLKSHGYALTKHHDHRSKEKIFYTLYGTAIDNKERFKTIEEVYDAVNQNYIENVLSSNKSQENQL